MHLWEVDATVEDTDLLGIDGRAQSAVVPVTGYHVWWRESSMVDAYRYHRRVAQLLQSRRPPSAWLFKSPHMSFHLDDFVVAYPDARFVVTHRDPVKAVPSWISFVSSLVAPGTLDVTDLTKFGPHLAAHLAVGTDQMMRARRELDDVRFLDIHHHELVADPMGTITRVYTWLGLELTPNTQTAMSAWSEKNRSGAHGAHRYTAEQFGLDNATLRSQFKEYTDHFDVRLEE
jgi:Sulfotransferase family